MSTLRHDRYGELVEVEEEPRHPVDCPGLIGDPDRPQACPRCRPRTRDLILRQRLRDFDDAPGAKR
jgi:hypothetical protein